MDVFSQEELIDALRLALDEDDAVEIGTGAYAIGEEARMRVAAAGRSADEQAFIHLAAMNLSEDTLILLALSSDQGARNLREFRLWRQRVGGATEEWRREDDARWAERYSLLAAAHGRAQDPP